MQEQVKVASQVADAAAPVLGAVAGAIVSGLGNDDNDRPSRRRRERHRPQESREGGGLLDHLFGDDSSQKKSGGSGGGFWDELLRDTDPSDDGHRGR